VRCEVVLDGLVEDRGERINELAQRGGAQGAELAAALIAQVGPGPDGLADLVGLAELVGLELLAELRGDLVQAIAAEERGEVRQAPAVVDLRVSGNRSVAELPGDLPLQPPAGVIGEGPGLAMHGLEGQGWLGALPDSDADAGEDVAQLGSGGGLVPSAAAAAGASAELVQDDPLASAVEADAQMERAGPVGEDVNVNRPVRDARHQAALALRLRCIGT
jgi:hypothetical protein